VTHITELAFLEPYNAAAPQGGEIGAHSSGGLDSSAISVLAARKLRDERRTLHAYSFLDRQRKDISLEDETKFVRAVVEQESDIDWTPIRPPAAVPASFKDMDADKMTPLGADVPENAVCVRAQEQGVGLMLSGWGGDEGATFNGRGTFVELLLRGRWRTLAREISALGRERGWPVTRILRSEILSYLVPEQLTDLAKRIARRDSNLRTLLPQSLSSAARRRVAALRAAGVKLAPDGRENRWRLMTSPYITERAEVWAHIGARHGLAFAFPLLDRRVVEFSLSLPSELFLRGGFRRRAFRDAMADVLPESVRWRHQKYRPFPGRMLDLADGKDEFLARIDHLAGNQSVCRLFDLANLRRQVEAFPPLERLRRELCGDDNPTSDATMVVALSTFSAAEYLAQHSGQASTSRGNEAAPANWRAGLVIAL
jgi:asparagine synthase (glutamine-hydrolysing)